MSNIVSSRQKIQVEATRFRSAVGESVTQAIGGSVNYLIDERDNLQAQITTNTSNINSVLKFGSATPLVTNGTCTSTAPVALITNTTLNSILIGKIYIGGNVGGRLFTTFNGTLNYPQDERAPFILFPNESLMGSVDVFGFGNFFVYQFESTLIERFT